MGLAIKVRDCHSAAEVIENRREVLSRIRAWKAPEKPRIVAIVKEVEQEVATLAQQLAPEPVPDSEPAPSVERVEEIRQPAVAEIVATVCRTYSVSKLDIHSMRRSISITRPRQIAMYLARHLTTCTLPQIGRLIGGRDHTTVMHAIDKIKGLRETYPTLDAELRAIERELTV